MSPELRQLLHAIAADPAKLGGLTEEQERSLLASLRDAVDEALQGSKGPGSPTPPGRVLASPEPPWSTDDLLTVDEAAATLRVSPRWLYRHAKTLPFTRKLSRKVLRFSRAGIARWLATKRLSP